MKNSRFVSAFVGAILAMAVPLQAGEGKTFKEEVLIEQPSKWWNAEFSTGWDSLYMFRGVNVLRNDKKYGSGLYWIDGNATWNITDNDFLTVGAWYAVGLGNTTYKELDVYTNYTRTFGDLSVNLGYIFYYVVEGPSYSHELNAGLSYEFDLGFMTLVPSITYFFNLGPGLDNLGFAKPASSYLDLRLDAEIPLYKDIIALAPWIAYGINFSYNFQETGPDSSDTFNGGNNLELGIGLPIQLTEIVGLYAYGAYSYQWQDLVGTQPSTFWGETSLILSF